MVTIKQTADCLTPDCCHVDFQHTKKIVLFQFVQTQKMVVFWFQNLQNTN